MRGFLRYVGLIAFPVCALAITAQAQPTESWPGKGHPGQGASLYEACVPCHGMNGNAIAGQSEAELLTKMQAIQNGSFDEQKIQQMQAVLKPMTKQQLLDLAAYISKM